MFSLFALADAATPEAAASAASAAGKGNYWIDVLVFCLFLAGVIFIALSASRKSGSSSESYFLAGRGLSWWLIGFSLIAANISAEQFVGMSGNASNYIGLAVASYEWVAALSLVIVAFFFLPRFLRAGIYTIPEYLENRYSKSARTIMSLMMMVMLVCVNFTAVTFAGAKNYAVFFGDVNLQIGGWTGNPFNLYSLCWVIGILAAVYVFAGGLKACAWADLLQGSALIVGGAIVLYFALNRLGAADPNALASTPEMANSLAQSGSWERFNELNASKLRMNLPSSDTFLPITALFFAIWIPNLYYWGLNQYIIQRTLGAQSLGQGQMGLVFAAMMKLLIPFIIIFPGMIAFNLYHSDMNKGAQKAAQPELDRLAQFQQGVADATAESALFAFNQDFATLHPDKAEAMLNYNAKITGIAVPAATAEDGKTKSAEERQNEMRKEITAKSQTDPSAQYQYGTQVTGYDHDAAFPLLVKNLLPTGGFKGFLLAALLGAIISSVAAMLNAASTIFTMDIFKEYLHPKASQATLVFIGRVAVIIFVLVGCWIAPQLARPEFGGIFKFIQEFQGYISPGILAVFAFGFLVPRAPAICGALGLLLCPIFYGFQHMCSAGPGSLNLLCKYCPAVYEPLHNFLPGDFLNRMAITFGAIIVVLALVTMFRPRSEPYVQEVKSDINLQESNLAKVIGVLVVLATIALYIYYWDYGTPMFK